MDKVSLTFLVFFEDPFWIGIVERISDGTMEVCRITFGAEPKDYEVYEWLLKNYDGLRFSPAVKPEAQAAGGQDADGSLRYRNKVSAGLKPAARAAEGRTDSPDPPAEGGGKGGQV